MYPEILSGKAMLSDLILTHFMRARANSILRFASRGSADPAEAPIPQPDHRYLLYLHVPFCEQLCPYCSFNRVRLDRSLAERYFQALEREIHAYHGRGYRFDSIYVGGGTPTVLPQRLNSILRLAGRLWPIERISVETNPNHLRPEILQPLKNLGVKRLSVGVQSFQDSILKAIGRYRAYGSGNRIARQLEDARGIFDTLNVDMIFNFPMQDEHMLDRDLDILEQLDSDQITFYPLMAARQVRRELAAARSAAPDRERRFYNKIWDRMSGRYRPSSAWCFSRKNDGEQYGTREMPASASEQARGNRSKHLIDEYIVASEEYAGLGSGSFGYLDGRIYANTFSIPRYIESLDGGRLPLLASHRFTTSEQIRYDFLMKTFGGRLDLERLSRKYGFSARRKLWKELLFLRAAGALRGIRARPGTDPGHGEVVELNRKGYYLLVVLMREFFTGVNNFREACLAEIASADPEGEYSPVQPV